MRRQDPVPMLHQSQIPKELAKLGSLAAVLKCVGREEQRFQVPAATSDAGIGTVPVRVLGAGVVDEPLCSSVPKRLQVSVLLN